MAQVARDQFSRVRLGEILIEPWLTSERWRGQLRDSFHHIGATRFGADPRTSVVDPDCQVHDVAGLYVAGSSVFPTAGYVNPTLMIIAMAIRLADHLKHAVPGL